MECGGGRECGVWGREGLQWSVEGGREGGSGVWREGGGREGGREGVECGGSGGREGGREGGGGGREGGREGAEGVMVGTVLCMVPTHGEVTLLWCVLYDGHHQLVVVPSGERT